MAIKINGDLIISNTRDMSDISVDYQPDVSGAADGGYFEPFIFTPEVNTITSTINMGTSYMTGVMTANTTYTISGTTNVGTCSIVTLDTTTTGHIPSFPNNVSWESNIEPTWSDWRYWVITMAQVANTEVRAAAVGYISNASAPTETISLEGTTGTPEAFFDKATSDSNDFVAGWTFNSDGNVYKYESIYNVGGMGTYLHDSTTWNNITPSQTYWIQVNNHDSRTLSVSDSDTIGEWISLASTRTFRYRDGQTLSTYASRYGTMKVDIAERDFGTAQHSTSSPRYYSATVGYIDGEGFNETIHNAYWNDTLVYSGGIASTTSPGDIFLGTDGNYYRTGDLQQTVGNPPTYSYEIQQATFTIQATGYYRVNWEGNA
jgi:hypothetical protein